jgi:hypothetical protein
MRPSGQPSSYRAIENLIATYAVFVDGGDFASVGILLADATFTGGAGSVSGRDAIERMLRDNVIVYDDGTPRTKHVVTISRSRSMKGPARRSRVRTSQCCKRCPTSLCSPSSVVATTTASSAASNSGASRSGRSGPISSAT